MVKMLAAVVVCGLALAATADEARVYFQNETTGAMNSGPVGVQPGDLVSIRFRYHGSASWGALQLALQLDGNNLIPASDSAQWKTSVYAVLPPDEYYTHVAYGPAALYDDAREPNDSTSPIVSAQALYLLYQVTYSKPASNDIEVVLFQFRVADNTEGQELHWIDEGRVTQNGVSTRLIVQGIGTQTVTDNYLRVKRNHVRGRVEFMRVSTAFQMPSTVTMRITADGGEPTERSVPLSKDGSFDILLPAGIYQLSVKHTHWLRRNVIANLSGGDVDGVVVSLENGDAYDDNVVDARDLNSVLVWFRLSGAGPVDLDESGIVDIVELNIVLTNFRLVGDP